MEWAVTIGLKAVKGDDHLYGDTGNDVILGGEKVDTIYGGDGDDTLSGGDDDDIITGGAGADQFDCGDGNSDKVLDYSVGEGDTEKGECEALTVKSPPDITDEPKPEPTFWDEFYEKLAIPIVVGLIVGIPATVIGIMQLRKRGRVQRSRRGKKPPSNEG